MKSKIAPLIWVISLLLHINVAGKAQHHHHDENGICQFEKQQEAYFKANPEAREEHLRSIPMQEALIQHLKSSRLKGLKAGEKKYIIPVVFHVFGQVQSGQKVTYELIDDALKRVNNDFAGISPGQNNIHARFKNIVAHLPVEFRLAKIDPNGKACTGVTFHPVASGFGNGSGYTSQIQKFAWDNKKYMNVYVMNDLYGKGVLNNSGVAWFPSESMMNKNLARVVYNGRYIGNNTNENFRRVLTHEFGHFFNLSHTFFGGCPEKDGGDHCNDTPVANKAHMKVDEKNCLGQYTNTQNFMNYTSDYEMFTQDQVTRMRAAMDHPARRPLWQESNLMATGVKAKLPVDKAVADMIISTPKVLIKHYGRFKDFSNCPDDDQIMSWNWIFKGGVPAGFTGETPPQIYYATPGSYDVSLTIKTRKGRSHTKIINNAVIVREDYCKPAASYRTYSGITSFTMGSMTNATPNDARYNSYRLSKTIDVQRGERVPFSITLDAGGSGNSDAIGVAIWVDWNHNSEFESDERIFYKRTSISAFSHRALTLTGNVVVPMDAALESSAVRAMVYYGGDDGKFEASACSTIDSGEIEDYGIRLTSATAIDDNNATVSKVDAFPNPTDGLLTISVRDDNIKSLSVYSISGRKMIEFDEVNNISKEVDMSQWSNGVYILKVEMSKSQEQFKVIKK